MAEPARTRRTVGPPTIERRPPTDPVLGWRYWQLRPDGLLRSVTHRRVVWRPDEPLRAVCLIGGHAAPAAGCACGVHAEPTLEILRAQGLCTAPGEPLVMGRVALWGSVVTDDHGLRAEFASPRRLALVTDEASPPSGILTALGRYCGAVDAVTPGDAMGDVAAAVLSFQSMSR